MTHPSPQPAGPAPRPRIRRRAVLLALALAASPAWPQAYPAQPIRLVVPFSAGSATDVLARQLAAALGHELGQPVNIDNKPGGAAVIGANIVAHSPANGYTLLLGSSQSHATNSSLFRKLSYDPLGDFAPVARVSVFPAVLVVRSGLPAKSVAELVNLARQSTRRLNYASSGPGTQAHLQSAMLAATAGIPAEHIPFKDAGQILTAFARGDVDFMFYPHSALLPMIQSGQVRVLATTGEQRNDTTRAIPTMAEAGYPEVMLAAWNAIYAPAGTPPAVIERLNVATQRALDNPQIKARLGDLGVETWYVDSSALGEFTRLEIERYRKLVALTGIKID